jgi:phage gp37-like protein
MSDFSWTTVEDAVLAALQAQIGDKVKTLKTHQGNWREDLKREGWRLPTVLVALEESRAEQIGVSSYDLTLQLSILVIVRQLRGEAAARREEGGVYEILAGIHQALCHQDLG